MKLLLSMVACALVASAQNTTNVPTVTLTGDPLNPTIVNHSGKQILAAEVVRQLADGTHTTDHRRFTHDANQLPDGGSEVIGRYSSKPMSPTVSAKIIAVIFADGEFRGEETDEFRSEVERDLQSMRELWQTAKKGDWDAIQKKAADERSPNPFFDGAGYAHHARTQGPW
jgi:hypothetical protein